ncbi:conserved exported hypothetical protein [uncultured delta proteobacterium]|uniref:Uncharacterized protein n=1 Tax=uncultured delta proteobacterium TaxID=34034 RepID=A0A212JZQ3_9DELT|nr:conserved exported hypothetical protein [uncultured delta proteobacterium]
MLREFLKKNGIYIALMACVLLFGPGSLLPSAAAGPEDSIRMLQQGIDTKDLSVVETYLDIDGVVAKGLTQVLADPELVNEAAQNPAIAMVLALGGNAATNEALRSLLVSEARSYVTYGVVSGAFAGKPEKTATPYQGVFGKVFRGGEKDKKVFGPAKVKQSGKNGAVVTTVLADGTKGRAYPLELRMARQEGVWRVVEVANAADFMRKSKEKNQ